MNKSSKVWFSSNEAVFFITLILFTIGSVNVFSASFVLAGQILHDSYFFLKRHLASFVIGFIAMLFFARMNYHNLRRFLLPIAFATVGLLIAVHFSGVDANGARRWLNLGGLKFQPSEIAKLAVIIMTASFLGPRIDRAKRITLFSGPFYFSMITGAIVLKQPDMGTALIIWGICIVLYIVAGLPRQQLMMLAAGGVSLVVGLAFAASYRAERISAWLNPWAYEQTTGYQTVQSLLAIGSGGILGSGLGMGTSKFYYLPEAHTDFAYAVLCQEIGFIGAAVVLVLLAMLGYHGCRIALNAPDGFGRMLAVGSTTLIVGQAVINIAMVSGLLPVIGVPLPFISFGGTSLIINFIAVGLLMSVGRRSAASGSGPVRNTEEPRRRLRLVSNHNSVGNG